MIVAIETKHMPFEKGKSGNPKGRPKGLITSPVSLRATVMKLLTPEKAEAIMKAFLEKAEGGDVKALTLLAELVGEIGKNVPQVAVQINQNFSEEMLLERAKKYAGLLPSPSTVITTTPISASISSPPVGTPTIVETTVIDV